MKVTPVGKNFNQHKIGDVFTLPDKSALLLIRIGKLSEVIEAVAPNHAPAKRAYRRRDMQAES